jgi:hypothetical protein
MVIRRFSTRASRADVSREYVQIHVYGSWEWMKGAAALSDGNYRKNSDFSQYSSRLFLETESRRPVSHKALSRLVCTHDRRV